MLHMTFGFDWPNGFRGRSLNIMVIYEVQSESSRTVLVVLFVFNEESQNFAY